MMLAGLFFASAFLLGAANAEPPQIVVGDDYMLYCDLWCNIAPNPTTSTECAKWESLVVREIYRRDGNTLYGHAAGNFYSSTNGYDWVSYTETDPTWNHLVRPDDYLQFGASFVDEQYSMTWNQDGVRLVFGSGLECSHKYICDCEEDDVEEDGSCVGLSGNVYANGGLSLDECGNVCECVDGLMINCCRARQSYVSMSTADRELFHATYLAARTDPAVSTLIQGHSALFSANVHSHPNFLPWHRWFILQLENALQAIDCRVTVPYWDWGVAPNVATSALWDDANEWAGPDGSPSNGNCVMTGQFSQANGFSKTDGTCLQRNIQTGLSATTLDILALLNANPNAADFSTFTDSLEHGLGLHDSVHCLVHGTMCSTSAAEDPVFFLHHAHIDKIWSMWQAQSAAHKIAFSGNAATTMPGVSGYTAATPADMFDLLAQPGGVCASYKENDWNIAVQAAIGDDAGTATRSELSYTDSYWWEIIGWDATKIASYQSQEQTENAKSYRQSPSYFEDQNTNVLDSVGYGEYSGKLQEYEDSISANSGLLQGLAYESQQATTTNLQSRPGYTSANSPPANYGAALANIAAISSTKYVTNPYDHTSHIPDASVRKYYAAVAWGGSAADYVRDVQCFTVYEDNARLAVSCMTVNEYGDVVGVERDCSQNSVSYDDAVLFCQSNGHRLPTLNEVKNGATIGGCLWNKQKHPIWTSTHCDPAGFSVEAVEGAGCTDGTPVASPNECRVAAEQLGLSFSDSVSDHPGCTSDQQHNGVVKYSSASGSGGGFQVCGGILAIAPWDVPPDTQSAGEYVPLNYAGYYDVLAN